VGVVPIEHPRRDYHVGTLGPDDVADGPLRAVRRWLDEAIAAELPEPTAVTLATVDADGLPDARVVLLRGFDDRGAVWFTNRHSAKGRQLARVPTGALVAYWPLLERQIRLRGPVAPLSDAESDVYFASRPRDSQLGAWASAQSEPMADRIALEQQVAAVRARFAGREVPRPAHWGGYLLTPHVVEFWQGRASRLHDRIRCTRQPGQGPPHDPASWHIERLQP
jgi:pyridoxamine 5'-phosphate oxidase